MQQLSKVIANYYWMSKKELNVEQHCGTKKSTVMLVNIIKCNQNTTVFWNGQKYLPRKSKFKLSQYSVLTYSTA